jgi:hypothetical protein
MTTNNNNSSPPCYGKLDTVFPMQADGLRRTPESCTPCPHKTACLRDAAAGREGLKIAQEKVDRAYASGNMGFFERWLKKKTLAREISEKND